MKKKSTSQKGQLLHDAVAQNSITGVRALLEEEDCALDDKDAKGDTPLLLALKNGRAEIATLLLDSGADYEIPDKANKLPAEFAKEKNMLGVLSLISVLKEKKGRTRQDSSEQQLADAAAARILRRKNSRNASSKSLAKISMEDQSQGTQGDDIDWTNALTFGMIPSTAVGDRQSPSANTSNRIRSNSDFGSKDSNSGDPRRVLVRRQTDRGPSSPFQNSKKEETCSLATLNSTCNVM